MLNKIVLLIIALLFAQTVAAEQKSGLLTVDSSLYASPDVASSVSGQGKEGATVNILQRQGGWYQIKLAEPDIQGWVKSYDVQVNANINWMSRMKQLISGGYMTQPDTTSTIGVRGLGPGDVKKAAPDKTELKKLDKYRKDIAEGLAYASAIPLNSNEVDWLDEKHQTAGRQKNLIEGAADGVGSVVDGIGDSVGGAVKGLKGLFGGGKKDE